MLLVYRHSHHWLVRNDDATRTVRPTKVHSPVSSKYQGAMVEVPQRLRQTTTSPLSSNLFPPAL